MLIYPLAKMPRTKDYLALRKQPYSKDDNLIGPYRGERSVPRTGGAILVVSDTTFSREYVLISLPDRAVFGMDRGPTPTSSRPEHQGKQRDCQGEHLLDQVPVLVDFQRSRLDFGGVVVWGGWVCHVKVYTRRTPI